MCRKLVCLTVLFLVVGLASNTSATLLRGAFYFRADSDGSARIGPHPDIMVRFGDGDDKLIFRRDKGYLPVWYTEGSGEENFSVEITRSNCENTINPFSRVSIIETNPARAIVHWRYARDCSNVGTTGWVDEYFTVYPDGVCMRTVKDAAGTTFAQWEAGTPDIYGLRLLPGGISTLPASWLDPAALSITSGDYSDEGFNDERRCYTLQCNVTSDPTVLNATLDTSGGKSIHNPVIVIKNWGAADAQVSVDGQRFRDCYVGYGDDMYGAHLVVWVGIETTSSIDISIAPSGGSGQFVDRALPPDFGYDFETDVPPLPMGSPEPGPFGAYYTRLRFNNKFDELWRVGDHTDVVVQFDDNAHRFVFWRGTNYGPHWASDASETLYSNWYGTQFVERRGSEWGLDGCCEPMQDWECRYSHVRIISSNPARAIVHWRYAPCDKHYDIPRAGGGDVWGDWAEEYFTIYPDAISVRKVTAYSSRTGGSDMESPHIEFHEAIPVTNPRTIPEDNIHWNALSATNYDGNKKDWVAQDVDGGAMTGLDQIADKPIMVVRMKGSTVPVSIVEGTSVEHDPVGQHDCRPFNAYDDWPGWPEADRSAGGWYWDEDPDTHCYRNFWTKYPSHCSILHLKWDDYIHQVNEKRTKLMLFGMFDAGQAADVNNLLPLARSWQYAPTLSIISPGFSGGSYDKAERAYKISRDPGQVAELELTMNASSNSPVHNPCFVIENWDGEVQLAIDGEAVEPGPDFRQGIEKTADGISSLVIWLKKDSTSPLDIYVLPSQTLLEAAYYSSPPDGANDVAPSVLLSWSPGKNAASHDVYFGTDFDDVNDANDPNVLPGRGRQDLDANEYNPPGLLEVGQSYYWRIDENNDIAVNSPWKGDVWSFTVADVKATNPSPANGVWSVPVDANLNWTPGCLADRHDVYLGTDFNDVNNATNPYTPPGGGRQVGTSYDPPGDLAPGTTYYWRIDEVNDSGIAEWPGDIWSFRAAGGVLVHFKFDGTIGQALPDPITDSTGNVTFAQYDGGGSLTYGSSNPIANTSGTSADFSPEMGLYRLDSGSGDVLDLPVPAYTIEVFIRPDSMAADSNMVLIRKHKPRSGTGGGYVLALRNDNAVHWTHSGADEDEVSSPAGWIVPGNWYHIAAVFDSTDPCEPMKLYVDGMKVAVGTISCLNLDTADPIGIGERRLGDGGNEDFFDGLMDELRISDKALTPRDFLIRGDLGCAWNPRPLSRAKDVPRDMVLSWRPGDYAQDVNAHEVYFGTDFDDVNDANTTETLDVYKGPQDADANSYDSGGLDLGSTYYWRIDEVNDANLDSPWKGYVWYFTVTEYLVVDDMESYTTEEPDRIYDTWHDWSKYQPVGGQYPTAAQVTIEAADANVHGGEQSMKFQYNNSDDGGWYFYRDISEIDANTIGPQSYLEIGQDWTVLGVKALTLHFIGHPDNDANEQMYVALKDSAGRTAVVPYGYYDDEDMNDIKKQEWTEWNIRLEDFNDINDVDLTDVTYVYIGFGNRDNPTVGGSGIVFFDDIRLYVPRCIPDYGPGADLSGNCIVDFADLQIMADEWLKSGDIVADLYWDNKIDFKDYAILTEGWLEEKLWPAEE